MRVSPTKLEASGQISEAAVDVQTYDIYFSSCSCTGHNRRHVLLWIQRIELHAFKFRSHKCGQLDCKYCGRVGIASILHQNEVNMVLSGSNFILVFWSANEFTAVEVWGTQSGFGSVVHLRHNKWTSSDATYDNRVLNVSQKHRGHILRSCSSRHQCRLSYFLLARRCAHDLAWHYWGARLFRRPVETYSNCEHVASG